jgi:hypothetical protein
MASRFTCQARILNNLYSTPVPYWTTKECEAETNKRISIDSGEAYMSICACCFKRFIRRSVEKEKWYGWFDCDYPPEARVVGSKWFYENVKYVKATPTVVATNTFDPEPLPLASAKEPLPLASAKEPLPLASAKEPEIKEPEPEVTAPAPEPEVKELEVAALEKQMAKLSIQDKKEDLKRQIKAIQARAKPSIMTMKELHVAFKQITELKTQIHML